MDAAWYGRSYMEIYDKENNKRDVREPYGNVTSVLMHVGELSKAASDSQARGGPTPSASSSLLSGSPKEPSQPAAYEDLQAIFKLDCFQPALKTLLQNNSGGNKAVLYLL